MIFWVENKNSISYKDFFEDLKKKKLILIMKRINIF